MKRKPWTISCHSRNQEPVIAVYEKAVNKAVTVRAKTLARIVRTGRNLTLKQVESGVW